MSDAADFIDAALQREASWDRADGLNALDDGLRYYGASVGAVRGTVRDALRKYPNLTHDDVVFLSSELWDLPVFERRLAAVVLLQSKVRLLRNSDLTRIEGFLRSAVVEALIDPLAADVIEPLIAQLAGHDRAKADVVVDRWSKDAEPLIRRAAHVARASGQTKAQH
ncbi:hypothetical protein BJ994_002832 [Arthrobacter pigmenti]|uniref:DNA alkylation repair protein n=1 Tax=Arthrobacter pigmenti TaxID=271432 RepID=A0A846RXP8_9MICC|nr:DNA alkylation repair protein [Arthrobacter pigmenti]NJC23756.1 hypothetical protein [Arthrobacter pigmenti]